MKIPTYKIGATLFLTLCLLFSGFAQQTFVTNEVRQYMSKGEQNGIEIILNGSNIDAAKSGLKKLSKKYKAKMESSKKSPNVFIDNARIATASANTVDIYVTLVPVENGTKATFFTDLGGAFISSAAYGTQYTAMDAVVKEFAQNQALTAVGNQLNDEEKAMKTMKKDLKNLQKSKTKNLKEIEEAQALILKLQQENIKNDADQAAKQQQITLQDQIIQTIKSKRSLLKN